MVSRKGEKDDVRPCVNLSEAVAVVFPLAWEEEEEEEVSVHPAN